MAETGFENDVELLAGFAAESLESLGAIDEGILAAQAGKPGAIDEVFRVAHTLKGAAGFFGLTVIKDTVHALESALDEVRGGRRAADSAWVDACLSAFDLVRALFADLAATLKARALTSSEAAVVERLSLASQAAGVTASPELLTMQEPQASAHAVKRTMRIDESVVDAFMSYVGDLIVTTEGFSWLLKRMEEAKVPRDLLKDFKQTLTGFGALSTNLQHSLMEVRKLPLKTVTGKLARLVRDLSQKTGKELRLEVVGEDLLVDKSLIDVFGEALVHLVRNSADHGIEPTEERRRAGKPVVGILRVSAACDRKQFRLTLEDDGRGIDPAKMRSAIVSKGLMSQEEALALSDREAVHLIFRPGFSTAEALTEVSGRGVGMDAVLTSVRRALGELDVESEVGRGTRVSLSLPLARSLVVTTALVARVAETLCVLPANRVAGIFRPEDCRRHTVEGRQELVVVREKLYPSYRLRKILFPELSPQAASGMLVLVDMRGKQGLLQVDEVLGLQQVVTRPFDGILATALSVTGTAILGNGGVALVLDPDKVLDSFSRDAEQQFRKGRVSSW